MPVCERVREHAMTRVWPLCRKLKKLLRRRKSDMDAEQEAELHQRLHRHEKDHLLGPFVGLAPEYMEMSESHAHTHTHTHTGTHRDTQGHTHRHACPQTHTHANTIQIIIKY